MKEERGDSQRDRGWGRWRWAEVGGMGTERDFALRDMPTMQYTNVLLN